MSIKITGLGSYIPKRNVKNTDFENHQFLNQDGSVFKHNNAIIVKKFKAITGIEQRKYVQEGVTSTDIAFWSAEKAISDAGIEPETLDYIIVAHNFGEVRDNCNQTDIIPSIASRVKNKLRIKNNNCVAYDLIFGCPGWVEAVIHARAFMLAGMAKRCLVIGTETLSKVVDPHDRDSMIYADGAGAAIIEKTPDDIPGGIFSCKTASFTFDESAFIFNGKSYNPNTDNEALYIKMYGRKIYEFALTQVPLAMKACLDESPFEIDQVSKILIHQANEKMDEAIVKRFYGLYDKEMPEGCMPMSITDLGNSSVATVPTLYDLIVKNQLPPHRIEKGDVLILASVGAGMNINAIVYQH